MNHCRTSAQARLQGRRERSTALTRLTGMAILLMVATIWPMAAFAADPAVETQDNAIVVFTVLVLLFGSVTAGLFFASPLRRRLSADPQERPLPQAPAEDEFTFDTDFQRRAEHLFQTLEQSPPGAVAAPAPPLPREQPLPVMAPLVVAPPDVATRPVSSWPSPTASAQLVIPAPSAEETPVPAVSSHRPVASPWSTGLPQPDANWNPGRRRAP